MTPPIVVVDDHAVISHSLADALRRTGYEVDVVDPVALDDAGIIDAARRRNEPIVLLDLHLADRASLDVIRPLLEAGCTVVLLTASDDEGLIGQAVEAGAAGVIHKSEPFHELVEAIADVAAGRSIMGAARREELVAAARRGRDEQSRHESVLNALTEAERAVLARLMLGDGVHEIAHRRSVGLETVRSQVKSILRKLGARNQVQALAIARDAGFDPGTSPS